VSDRTHEDYSLRKTGDRARVIGRDPPEVALALTSGEWLGSLRDPPKNRGQTLRGYWIKRAQRPVLCDVSRIMDLRSVRDSNQGQTLRGWSHAKMQRRKEDRCFVLSEAVLVLVLVIVIDAEKQGDSPRASQCSSTLIPPAPCSRPREKGSQAVAGVSK
jgi:hypothetical protein